MVLHAFVAARPHVFSHERVEGFRSVAVLEAEISGRFRSLHRPGQKPNNLNQKPVKSDRFYIRARNIFLRIIPLTVRNTWSLGSCVAFRKVSDLPVLLRTKNVAQ